MNANYENGVMKSLDNLLKYVSRLGSNQRMECLATMLEYSFARQEPADNHVWGSEYWDDEMIEALKKASIEKDNFSELKGDQIGHVMVYMNHFKS